MILLGNGMRLAVKRWLQWYCRRNKSIRHCFIRHSAASEGQNPLLSDFDITFFVEAASFDALQPTARRLRDELKRLRIVSCIVLPATEAAYRRCASHYPLRSVYPMREWHCVYGESLALPAATDDLVLDHAPESFLSSYVIPVIQGKRKSHVFEGALMRRKLHRDAFSIGGRVVSEGAEDFYDVVAAEVRLWDEFFGSIEFPSPTQTISISAPEHPSLSAFTARCGARAIQWSGLVSLWVYPCFFNSAKPWVVVNLEPGVGAEECKNITTRIVSSLQGLDFQLQIGTEQSMRARLSGLSRVSLIDPWLFKSAGVCLAGSASLRDEFLEPAVAAVRKKLQEYLLYVSYRIFSLRPYPYWLYCLAFTLDHLFRRQQLILNHDEISDIYGKAFLPQSRLQGAEGRERFFEPWKEFHAYDIL